MTFIAIGKGVNMFFFLTNVAMCGYFLVYFSMSVYMHKIFIG